MKTILLTNAYQGRPLDIVREEMPEGFSLLFLPEQTPEALLQEASDADYLLAGGRLPITRDVLDRAAKLKMIQRSGVGLDSLDLDAIREKGIPLYVNQGVNAESVAEHALLLMLACLRRLPVIDRNTKNGIWKKQEQGIQTRELKGKTVGLIGMGHIARTLVELLQPFGVKLLYFNRSRAEEAYEREKGLQFVTLDELLRKADVVSLHCALTEETMGLLNRDALEKMKPGAILINTARGGLIETAALEEALRSGRISFAGLDVHEREPIDEANSLKKLDQVILTPHIAGVTEDSFRAMMHDAFRNIACFDRGLLEEIAPYRYL